MKKQKTDGVVGFNKTRGYHLEFAVASLEEARALCEEFAANDIFAAIRTAKGATHIYLKDSDSICNLLALAGASKSLLELHDKIAMRQVRNISNRRANCDEANIRRQLETAAGQVEAFTAIKAGAGFEKLGTELQSTVNARLENPEATYEELANILKITKSGLVHRIKKVLQYS